MDERKERIKREVVLLLLLITMVKWKKTVIAYFEHKRSKEKKRMNETFNVKDKKDNISYRSKNTMSQDVKNTLLYGEVKKKREKRSKIIKRLKKKKIWRFSDIPLIFQYFEVKKITFFLSTNRRHYTQFFFPFALIRNSLFVASSFFFASSPRIAKHKELR